MKTKKLIDAFGAIDEDIFAKAEIKPSDDIESYPETPVVTESRKSLKPVFIGAVGIAAAIALAVGLPMLSDGRLDRPPFDVQTVSDTESGTAAENHEPDLSQWDLKQGCRLFTNMEPLNAAELYSVTETVLTAGDAVSTDGASPDAVRASCPIPAYIDGDSFYYTTDVTYYDALSPNKNRTGEITLKLNGKDYTILEDSPRHKKCLLKFLIQGVYNGALYYYRVEYGDDTATKMELCRIDLSDLSDPVNESISPASMGRCVQSGAYLYFSHYTEEGAFIYRYETVTGELEIFKKNAEYPSPYKGGLVYLTRDDFSVYFHHENIPEDTLLFKLSDIRNGNIVLVLDTGGGYNITYTYSVLDEENNETGNGFGILKDNFKCMDIIESMGLDQYVLNSHNGDTDVGLIGLTVTGKTIEEKLKNPLIFDSETMSMAELYIEGSNFQYINSPSDCICVAAYDDENGDVKIYTVRRKQEEEGITFLAELENGKEKYNVRVISVFDETIREKLQIHHIYSSFIEGNSIFYTVDAPQEHMYDDPEGLSKTACIYRSLMDSTGGAELLLEEAPRIEGWGLYIKLIGIIGNYLYYERQEIDSDPASVGENGYEAELELCRINLNDHTNETILQFNTVFSGKYVISGSNIYIGEIISDIYSDEGKLYRIRRYNTVTGEIELFKNNAYHPSPYKEGIIYLLSNSVGSTVYYHNDSTDTDSFLFNFDAVFNTMFPPVAFGGDVIAVNHGGHGYSCVKIIEGGDGSAETFERIIADGAVNGISVNAAATIAPCKGFVPLGNLPMFYDEKNLWFAEIIDAGSSIKNIKNWCWIRSSEDTLCLAVFDDEQRVEMIYTVRKR